jgi:hypothetical protein
VDHREANFSVAKKLGFTPVHLTPYIEYSRA